MPRRAKAWLATFLSGLRGTTGFALEPSNRAVLGRVLGRID
jgi:hypothetical protein